MGLWHSAGGLAGVRLTSADPCARLRRLSESGVILYGVTLRDPLTAEFVLRRKDIKKADEVMRSCGEELERLKYGGVYWRFRSLIRRKTLVTGCVLLLMLSVYLPTRVLFIEVQGNDRIPALLIQETAAECGIYFGASRGQVRSEQVKNRLLQTIPELQWVGVNTAGCTATISVREKAPEVLEKEDFSVSRIVASRDGIISTVVCTSGNALCAPGQAVRAGQTLISGYTDCGLTIRAERAAGEIYAFTNHQVSAAMPEICMFRAEKEKVSRGYSLIIGKKRINLWKDSGISYPGCVKIYKEKWVCLPGGFRLPVKLAAEEWICHDLVARDTDAARLLQSFCAEYVKGRMISGSILRREEVFTQEEARLVMEGRYECLEMIGRERNEEILHGKDN